MCGRFTYRFTWKQLHDLMQLSIWPEGELTARYNVAPTQQAPIVRADDQGVRYGSMARWGLVPSWAKDEGIGNRLINARSETVATTPAFRQAFARRRCLVPMSGFYEWKAVKGSKTKQPYLIERADWEPVIAAGLWERHRGGEGGAELETFTVVTTAANEWMSVVHNRMPVILAREAIDLWLTGRADDPALARLMEPCPDGWLTRRAVSKRVGNPRNDDAELVRSVEEGEGASRNEEEL